MTVNRYAMVTPSFRLDIERCALLLDSVDRWVHRSVAHYVVVDRRDVPLFRPLIRGRTELLVVEDIVPKWLFRIPFTRRFWFSLRSRPVKNWILQQIVKLSMAQVLAEDVLLYTDSDVCFVAPYEPALLEREGRVPLFVEYGQRGLIPSNDLWHRTAAQIVGIPVMGEYDTNFIDNVVPWRRQNALALLDRIGSVASRDWPLVIAARSAFSEYITYGLFCQAVLGGAAQHWEDGVKRSLSYWGQSPLGQDELRALRKQCTSEQHAVMISAKSRTPVRDIASVFLC